MGHDGPWDAFLQVQTRLGGQQFLVAHSYKASTVFKRVVRQRVSDPQKPLQSVHHSDWFIHLFLMENMTWPPEHTRTKHCRTRWLWREFRCDMQSARYYFVSGVHMKTLVTYSETASPFLSCIPLRWWSPKNMAVHGQPGKQWLPSDENSTLLGRRHGSFGHSRAYIDHCPKMSRLSAATYHGQIKTGEISEKDIRIFSRCCLLFFHSEIDRKKGESQAYRKTAWVWLPKGAFGLLIRRRSCPPLNHLKGFPEIHEQTQQHHDKAARLFRKCPQSEGDFFTAVSAVNDVCNLRLRMRFHL